MYVCNVNFQTLKTDQSSFVELKSTYYIAFCINVQKFEFKNEPCHGCTSVCVKYTVKIHR